MLYRKEVYLPKEPCKHGMNLNLPQRWGISVIFGALLLCPAIAISAVEWSDIPYTEGNYSRIYFDYQGGIFYCINDWVINRDDGDASGDAGLTDTEYNQFTFTIGDYEYELHVFADGTHDLFEDGGLVIVDGSEVSGGAASITNLFTATGWSTSPDANFDHTIFEFQFDVAPVQIGTFIESDPGGSGVFPLWGDPLSTLDYAPSTKGHTTNGIFDGFGDFASPPDVDREDQIPIVDPWLAQGFNLTLKEGGGLIVEPIPEPASFFIWVGLICVGLAAARRQ